MSMDRPCIFRKIAPIIPEDAKLHEDHRDDHPFVEGFVLIHVYRWFY
jgi:hypothetical protein